MCVLFLASGSHVRSHLCSLLVRVFVRGLLFRFLPYAFCVFVSVAVAAVAPSLTRSHALLPFFVFQSCHALRVFDLFTPNHFSHLFGT